MRSHLRTILVLAIAAALLTWFLYNVDLRGVAREIMRVRPDWLLFSFLTMFTNLAIRAWRWQYLLEPLGHTRFGDAFRATAVGFAATAVLPARAGEIIRPYFLSRQARVSATGAFATIIIERLLDMLAVVTLMASYVFVFGADHMAASQTAVTTVKWAGATAAVAALAALVVLFVLAGHPDRVTSTLARLEAMLPSKLAGLLGRIAERFLAGLGAIRRPGRLAVSLLLSFPLWISIAAGIWAAAVAFHIDMPFTGSFLVVALLALGVAVPTPGAVGGFHAMFRYGATTFFSAPDPAAVGAAIVLHALTIGPSLLLGLFYAAQEGLNVAAMRQLAADQAEAGRSA